MLYILNILSPELWSESLYIKEKLLEPLKQICSWFMHLSASRLHRLDITAWRTGSRQTVCRWGRRDTAEGTKWRGIQRGGQMKRRRERENNVSVSEWLWEWIYVCISILANFCQESLSLLLQVSDQLTADRWQQWRDRKRGTEMKWGGEIQMMDRVICGWRERKWVECVYVCVRLKS